MWVRMGIGLAVKLHCLSSYLRSKFINLGLSHLLLPLHGAVGLDLELLEDLGGLLQVALLLLHHGQPVGQPGPLILHVDLA